MMDRWDRQMDGMDEWMDGWTDKAVAICSPLEKHNK